jgi:integrase
MARLTDLAVEKMAPVGKRIEVPDSAFPGLFLILQATGARSWALRYRSAGRTRKLTLGAFPALKLAGARKAAGIAIDAVSLGRDPAADKRAAAKTGSDRFDIVARRFVDRYAKPKNRSWRQTAWQLGLIPDPEHPDKQDEPLAFITRKGGVSERWRARKVGEIAGRDILDELDRIVDRGTPIVANRVFSALRKFFRWCVSRRIINRSPCEGLHAPSAEHARDRVLTDEELRSVWQACDHVGWPFGPLFQILILTGQRRDEIGQLRWAEIDFEERLLRLPRERMKAKGAHLVPLSNEATDILRSLEKMRGRAGYVFSTNDKTAVSGWSRAKERLDEKIVERMGASALPHWTLHDLRRTLVSGMPRLGVAVAVAEKIIDHNSGTLGGVVRVYQTYDFVAERRAALEAWGRHVASIVAPR